MEALAKMFFTFMQRDPRLREGVFQSIDFFNGLDARLRAIEAKLDIQHPPLDGVNLPHVGSVPNGQDH